MTVAFRADTGTLISNSSTGFIKARFIQAQPVADDVIVAGGSMHDGTGGTWTPTIRDDVEGALTPAASIDTQGAAAPFTANESAAVIQYRRTKGGGNPHGVEFTTGGTQTLAVGAIAFSGVNPTAPLDPGITATASTQNTDKTSQVSGTTGATSKADAVAVTALAVDNGANLTSLSVSGYQVPISSVDGTATAVGGLAYKVLSATGAQSATWTYGVSSGSANDDHAACIAVFRGADAVVGAVPNYFSDVPRPELLHQAGIPNTALRDARAWF